MKMFHTWRSRKVVTRFLFTLFSPPKSAKTYRGINLTDVRVTNIHEDNDTTPYNMGMGGSYGLFCQDALCHNTE